MRNSQKTVLNKNQFQIVKVLCNRCKNPTNHKILTSVEESGSVDLPYDDFFAWNNNFEIIECQGCQSISFRLVKSDSETSLSDDEYIDETIYPEREIGIWKRKSLLYSPFQIRSIYRETIDSFDNGCFNLCAAGLRMLVEAICKHNGITKGPIKVIEKGVEKIKNFKSLEGKINGLSTNGKLSSHNARFLHEHRFLGNNSVHLNFEPTKEELKIAIEIIEHIIETIYELPEKAEELESIRLKKTKKKEV